MKKEKIVIFEFIVVMASVLITIFVCGKITGLDPSLKKIGVSAFAYSLSIIFLPFGGFIGVVILYGVLQDKGSTDFKPLVYTVLGTVFLYGVTLIILGSAVL